MEKMSAAQTAALAAISAHAPESSDAVEYSSHGKTIVVGDRANWRRAAEAVRLLGESASPALLEDASANAPGIERMDGIPFTLCRGLSASGHLGAFVLRFQNGDDGEDQRHADAVLDLRESPLFARRVLPPGCFRPGPSAEELQQAAESIAALRGVFRKPKYFRYDQSLCAHRSGGGCELCLSACPAAAIASAGDRIEVDPHLCQGCAACVMTCPGGALRYAYPSARDMLSALRAGCAAFRGLSGGAAPLALFHAAADAPKFARMESPITLPLAVEEVGAAGIEIWMCALAYGFAAVGVFAEGNEIRKLAESQASAANDILSAMNYPRAIRVLPDMKSAESFTNDFAGAPGLTAEAAKFAADDDKRGMFFAALDFLLDAAADAAEVAALASGAPFGAVSVDAEKCTLCMACAGVCPASALRAGGDSPRLLFVEENCLQCGLCETACPEDAVSLRPRLLFSPESRRASRTLNEDAVFGCVACGKPFASTRMIARVEAKLRGHWMYQDAAARRRLRLCEDCRAADILGGTLVRRRDGDENGDGDAG